MAKKSKPKKKVKKPKKEVKKPQKKVRPKKVKNEIKEAEKKLEKAAKAQTEEELRRKCKDLASIIEEMSKTSEEIPVTKVEDILQPKLKEVTSVFDEQLKGMKETLASLEKKMEKPTKLKGEVTGATKQIEENLEPRISGLEEKLKALDKIEELEKKFNEVYGETKDGKKFPKLSVLENRVIQTMQEDLLEVKEAVQNLYHSFNVMRDKTETKIGKIQESLTPETLEKLHELIAFLDQAVPEKVKEEVGDKFNTVFDRLKELNNNVSGLEKRMNKVFKDVTEIEQKFMVIKDIKTDIAELFVEKDKLYKTAENIRTESAQMGTDLEFKIQKEIDQLIKRFDQFDVIINNYLKDSQQKVNKSISDFSKRQILALEKRYTKKLSPIKEEIKTLQVDLSKFQNLVNSTFDSVRDSLDKLNLQLERIKETDKEKHLELEKKMMDQVGEFVSEPKNYTEAIEGAIDKFFSELAGSKLAEIQNKYVTGITTVRGSLNNLDARVTNFENTVNSTFDLLKGDMGKFDVRLQKLREDEVRGLLKLDKEIKKQKTHLEDTLKSYPNVIRANVEKIFTSMAETKLTEIEKGHHIDLVSVKKGVDDIETRIAGFEGVVNSTFDSVKDSIEKLNIQFEKAKEKENLERLRFSKKLMAQIEKFVSDPKNYSKAVEGSIDTFFIKLAQPKLSNMEKNLQKEITSFETNITDLKSELLGFENVVNSNFSSVKDDIDKFNLQLEKLREEEKKELLKFDKKLAVDIAQFNDTLKTYPKVIRDYVGKFFKSMAESKLTEIEKEHHIDLISVKKGVDDLETRMAGFDNNVNSTFDTISDNLDKLNLQLQKLKEEDVETRQKFEKRLMIQVEKFVSDPKNYSKVIGKELDKLFSSIAKSKLSEFEKDYNSKISSVTGTIDDLQSNLSSFQTDVNSTFDSLEGTINEFNVKLQKLREDEEKEHLKIEKKLAADIANFKDILKTYPRVIKDKVEKFFTSMAETKLSEIEKKHHINLMSVKKGVDDIDTRMAGFENGVNSTFDSVRDTIEKLKLQLEKTREKENFERLRFSKKLIKQVESFVSNPKNYSKAVEGSMDTFFSELAEPKLSEMEENLHEEITSFENTIADLQSKINSFGSLINSSLSSMRDDIDKFDVKVENLKEKEKEELIKLEKRIKAEKSNLEDTLKTYPKVIRDNVEKIFASMAESKLTEIEKKHHIDLISVKKGVDDIETRVAGFEGVVNSTFKSISDSLDEFNLRLEKLKEKDIETLQRFEKKLISFVEKFVNDPKNYSKVIGKEVDKQFSSIAKSKLSEMNDKYITRISSIDDGLNNLENSVADFENAVNSTFDLLKGDMDKFGSQIQKLREDEEKEILKLEKRITSEKSNLEDTLKSYPKVIRDYVEEFFSSMAESKLSEIEKKHHIDLLSVKKGVDDLETKIAGFGDVVNSTFDSLKDSITKLNIQLDEVKEEENLERSKFSKKLIAQVEKFIKNPKNYSKVIGKEVDKQFSSIAKSKLSEIEKDYHTGISSVTDSINDLQSNLSSFQTDVNSTLNSLEETINVFDVRLQKLKEDEEKEHLKIEKKLSADITEFKETLKTYPKVIRDNVEKIFASMAESRKSIT